ncbi:MAG: hypothetical protein U0236_02530 [Nitrospira sp.]
MALASKLFGGDKKLEACQANDSAHLTLGIKGEHVAKVQLAISVLGQLTIDRTELLSETYGPSTARNVLAFKTIRQRTGLWGRESFFDVACVNAHSIRRSGKQLGPESFDGAD